jgi:hypothetical protein
MFVCAAHDTDIVEALDRIEGAFKALKREFGDG